MSKKGNARPTGHKNYCPQTGGFYDVEAIHVQAISYGHLVRAQSRYPVYLVHGLSNQCIRSFFVANFTHTALH